MTSPTVMMKEIIKTKYMNKRHTYNTTWYTSIIIIPTSENSVDHLYKYHHDFYHLIPLLKKIQF